jgi:hypothetical protein
MGQQLDMPFPESVIKGLDYGSVDAVMVDADIFGWALRVIMGGQLSGIARKRLRKARDDLAASLSFFPDDARPYYEVVLNLATAALRGE